MKNNQRPDVEKVCGVAASAVADKWSRLAKPWHRQKSLTEHGPGVVPGVRRMADDTRLIKTENATWAQGRNSPGRWDYLGE